eukprot:12918883-Prorocentrum_lima.AAC.1
MVLASTRSCSARPSGRPPNNFQANTPLQKRLLTLLALPTLYPPATTDSGGVGSDDEHVRSNFEAKGSRRMLLAPLRP